MGMVTELSSGERKESRGDEDRGKRTQCHLSFRSSAWATTTRAFISVEPFQIGLEMGGGRSGGDVVVVTHRLKLESRVDGIQYQTIQQRTSIQLQGGAVHSVTTIVLLDSYVLVFYEKCTRCVVIVRGGSDSFVAR